MTNTSTSEEKPSEGFTNNIPIPLTSFIGRQKEIAAARSLLEYARLLTMTGTGGVGKSRLAKQLATQTLMNYPGGTWLVELASLKEASLVVQTIAATLNLQTVNDQGHLERLHKFLASKTCLIVLDNCEHLIEECARVIKNLLTSCPNLKILATSRETLAVEGEVVFRVPSLRLPQENLTPPSPAELLEYEAVRLFAERAWTVQPAFTINERNVAPVIQLCRRLDGIPLALELAAARLNGLNIEQIATRLDDRFRLLAPARRETLPRQKTLKALIDWSYDLLSPSEQILLRRLAIFTGGWSLEAAEEVAGFAPLQSHEVLALLLALINKSLVQTDPTEAQPRYSFLETIHQYSREKLLEAQEVEITREQHFNYFLQLARREVSQLEGPGLLEVKATLGLELNNFREAFGWCLENLTPQANKSPDRPYNPGLAKSEKGLELAGTIWPFWREQSMIQEGLYWLKALLEATPASPPSLARADAINGMAVFLHIKGDFEEALRLHRLHAEMRRELGDQAGRDRSKTGASFSSSVLKALLISPA